MHQHQMIAFTYRTDVCHQDAGAKADLARDTHRHGAAIPNDIDTIPQIAEIDVRSGPPHQGILTSATHQGVVASTADDHIAAIPTNELVVAVAPQGGDGNVGLGPHGAVGKHDACQPMAH